MVERTQYFQGDRWQMMDAAPFSVCADLCGFSTLLFCDDCHMVGKYLSRILFAETEGWYFPPDATMDKLL